MLNTVIDRLQKKALEVGYGALTQRERILVDVAWLEAEVNNGGFDQFFFNSSGDRFRETVSALRAIGAERTAALVAEAGAVFPDGPSPDRATRMKQMEAIPEDAFAAFDARFWTYGEALEPLLDRCYFSP